MEGDAGIAHNLKLFYAFGSGLGEQSMANLAVAANFSFNQSNFDFSNLFYGVSYTRTSTLFRVNYSDGSSDEFRGTGFTYDVYGEPYAGTVTSYGGYYNGQRLFIFEGASVAAASIVDAAYTWSLSDDAGVIINVMRGNGTLTGGNLADVLMGFDGNDFVSGNGGNDILYGDAGNDTIVGGAGGDRIDGGSGSDTASYATALTGVTAILAAASSNTNDAKGDTYYFIENLLGSRFNDVLAGNSVANSLTGGDGNDALVGGGGSDRLDGGNGIDVASYESASAGVVVSLANPSINTGDAKGDAYISIENLVGSKYADHISGNAGSNNLTGGSGNDGISGAAGNDWIFGGAGADKLYGGPGADKFVFAAFSDSTYSSFDSIFDFMTSDQDRIDLSRIDANIKVAGDQAFTFISAAAFTGAAGQVRYLKQESDTYIYADVNGDKVADFKMHLDDAVTLTKDYFIL